VLDDSPKYLRAVSRTAPVQRIQQIMRYLARREGLELDGISFERLPEGSIAIEACLDGSGAERLAAMRGPFPLGIVPMVEEDGLYLRCLFNEELYTFNGCAAGLVTSESGFDEAGFTSLQKSCRANERGEYPTRGVNFDDLLTWSVILTLNGVPYDTFVRCRERNAGLYLQNGTPVAFVNWKSQVIALEVSERTSFLEAQANPTEFLQSKYPAIVAWT
jgi:hypothetical protein